MNSERQQRWTQRDNRDELNSYCLSEFISIIDSLHPSLSLSVFIVSSLYSSISLSSLSLQSSLILLIEQLHSAMLCNDRIREDRETTRFNDWDELDEQMIRLHLSVSISMCIQSSSLHNIAEWSCSINSIGEDGWTQSQWRQNESRDNENRETMRTERQWRHNESSLSSSQSHCLSVLVASQSSCLHCLSISLSLNPVVYSIILSSLILLIEQLHSAMLYNEEIEEKRQ